MQAARRQPPAKKRGITARRYRPATFIVFALVGHAVNAQPLPATTPHFEVASIKSCSQDTPIRSSRGGGGSPGLLRTNCQTVRDLVLTAYAAYADGHVNPPPLPRVEGGPKWMDSERYMIEARAPGTPNAGTMQGPMLQALLEDRFQLKIRREFRDGAAYALTVASGGPKLQVHREGSCVDIGAVQPLPKGSVPVAHSAGERVIACGFNRPGGKKGPDIVLDVPGVTLDYFAKTFLGIAFPDRPVLNKTGLAGLFDIHLEFAQDGASPGTRPVPTVDTDVAPSIAGESGPTGPSIFTALQQQLGLKLVSARGPHEVIVIDRAERPSEN